MRPYFVVCFALFCASKLVVGQLITTQPTNTSQPWFCREGPCLPFQVLRNSADYEIRQYAAAPYAISTASDVNYTRAFALAFRNDFQYLNGLNSANVTIPAAGYLIAPTYIYPENTTVSVAVPLIGLNGSAAPRPLSPNVTLSTNYNGIYAVASFGDVANGTMIQSVAAQLGNSLKSDGLPYNSTIYTIIYDGPLRVTNRHNEVWLRLTNFTQADLAGAPQASAPIAAG